METMMIMDSSKPLYLQVEADIKKPYPVEAVHAGR